MALGDVCCDFIIQLKRKWVGNVLVLFQNNMSVDGKEDYSDLPPNQKKKKLQAKVSELQKQVKQNSPLSYYLFVFLYGNGPLSVCG